MIHHSVHENAEKKKAFLYVWWSLPDTGMAVEAANNTAPCSNSRVVVNYGMQDHSCIHSIPCVVADPWHKSHRAEDFEHCNCRHRLEVFALVASIGAAFAVLELVGQGLDVLGLMVLAAVRVQRLVVPLVPPLVAVVLWVAAEGNRWLLLVTDRTYLPHWPCWCRMANSAPEFWWTITWPKQHIEINTAMRISTQCRL